MLPRLRLLEMLRVLALIVGSWALAACGRAGSEAAPTAGSEGPRADLREDLERFAEEAEPALAEALSAALPASDDASASWEAVGRLLDAHRAWALAERAYGLDLASGAADARTALAHARMAYEQGRVDEAVEGLDSALVLAPQRAALHWRRGKWLYELGRFDTAEESFQNAIRLDPQDPSGTIGLARLLLEDSRPEEALELLEALLERQPFLHAVHLADRAATVLGRPTRLPPDRVVAPYVWSDPWVDELQELRVGLGPELEGVLAALRAGDSEDALARLEPMLASQPDNVTLQGMFAAACARVGRPGDAIAMLRDAQARQPRHYRIALNLSVNLAAAGEDEAALVEARRAVELHPGHAAARFQLGRLAERAGQPAEALAAYEAALLLDYPEERIAPRLEVLSKEIGE